MLVGIVTALLMVVVLLAIPVTVMFRVTWPRTDNNDIRLRWAFGLVDSRVSVNAPEATVAPDRRTEDDRPDRDRSGKAPRVVAAIRNRPFRRRAVRFVRDLWRSIDKENIRMRVRLGLGDPADTGQLWALMGPASALLSNLRDAVVSVEPEFNDATIEVDSSGAIRVVPLKVLYLGGSLLVSPAFWRGARLLRGG